MSASAAFFGHIGVAVALAFANLGAAYGTAKSGVGIASMGVLKPDMIMKSIVPIIMAGILGIYGLIVAVILLQKSKTLVPSTSLSHTRELHPRNGLQAPCLRPVLRLLWRCKYSVS